MRSSKSRSRGKSNRTRHQPAGGSVVNRVFDSSGPSGKVRGTPQQIIDKYNQLARDAHLSNDRVAAENFQQHAEHYMRLLSEAQREQDVKREEHDRQNRERQADRDRERTERQEREANAPTPDPERNDRAGDPSSDQAGNLDNNPDNDPGRAPQPDVLDLGTGGSGGDSGLVETPEGAPRKTRSRSRRKPAPKLEQAPESEVAPKPEQAPESEKAPKFEPAPKPAPKPKKAPKPVQASEPEADQLSDDSGTPEAAE